MNIKDITEKLKGTVIPKDVKKEEFELTEEEKKEIAEDENMSEEQKPISDEVETLNEPVSEPVEAEEIKEEPKQEEINIKTMIVTEEDQETEEDKKRKLMGKVKVAAGVALVTAAGIAAYLLKSKKKRW